MELRLIYGRAGTGKTSFCFKEIAQILEKEEKIFIITPEQFSFSAEQHLMSEVKTKAVINAEVLTFNRMAFRIISEIQGNYKKSLTESGRSILLYEASFLSDIVYITLILLHITLLTSSVLLQLKLQNVI